MKARDAHILWTPVDYRRRLLRRGDHPPGSVKVLPFLSGERKEAARYKRDAGASFTAWRHRSSESSRPWCWQAPCPCSEGRHASPGSALGFPSD
jgi:hypothetical protein